MDNLLKAILDDDHVAVEALLRKNAGLAKGLIAKPHLYNSKIFHWIYVGDTALHLAAAGYRVEIVGALLKAGADPNAAKNMRRSSPLHYAADGCVGGPCYDAARQVSTLRLLLKHGGEVNAQDKNGASPLHRAVRTRCASAVRCLLEAGADPLLKNKPGSTPFHLAVQNTGRGGSGEPAAIAGQRAIIETFLALGLSPELESAHGKSVRSCVQSEWIREVIEGFTPRRPRSGERG